MNDRFHAMLKVFYEISGSSDKADLAEWFNTSQSSISDAERQRRIPMSWIAITACKTGLKPTDIVDKIDIMNCKYLTF